MKKEPEEAARWMHGLLGSLLGTLVAFGSANLLNDASKAERGWLVYVLVILAFAAAGFWWRSKLWRFLEQFWQRR